MDLPASVEIVEVGPRDGLQNEATSVPSPGKISLIGAGIKRLEATSFVSPKAIPQLADAEDVLAGLPAGDGVVYGGLIPNKRGYERAKAAGVGEVVLVAAATEDIAYMFTEMGIKTGIDLEALMEASDLLERLVGHPLPARINRSLLVDPGTTR